MNKPIGYRCPTLRLIQTYGLCLEDVPERRTETFVYKEGMDAKVWKNGDAYMMELYSRKKRVCNDEGWHRIEDERDEVRFYDENLKLICRHRYICSPLPDRGYALLYERTVDQTAVAK